MDFELGVDAAEIESTIPSLEFTNTAGLNWQYADIRTGAYNVDPYGDRNYEINGNFFAWLGPTGDSGRITFLGGPASYVSVLVSTSSGVQLDAYDAGGNFLATSGSAAANTDTGTLTRLTVEAAGIAYILVHDTGNYWLMDDLCTDAPSPCQRVPGHSSGNPSERIDLVLVPATDYAGDLTTFRSDVDIHIGRLLTHPPLDTAADKFNFYFTEREGTAAGFGGGSCATLPDNLLKQCPFLDAAAVLHVGSFTDCTSFSGGTGIFGGEGHDATLRSFIHEGGHAMFRLADEYDDTSRSCATNYNLGLETNIWDTDADCEATVTANGGDIAQCYQFTTCQGGWFKLGDPTLATDADRYADANYQYIMLDGTNFANGWGDASTWRINTALAGLGARAELPLPEPSSEQSLFLKITFDGSTVSLLESGFLVSPAPNYAKGVHAYEVRLLAQDGSLLGAFPFDDPREIFGERGSEERPPAGAATAIVVVPYFFNIDRAEVVETASDSVLLDVDLSRFRSPAVAPVADAGGPYAGFVGEPIHLNASGSTQTGGTLVRYEWDLDGNGGVDVDTTAPLVDYVPTAKFNGLAHLRVTNQDGFTDVDSTSIVVVAKADFAVVSTAVVAPPTDVLIGGPVDVTVRSVLTNHGPSSPADALVLHSASAGAGSSVSPTNGQEQVLALQLDELRRVDTVYTISCSAPGAHTFTFGDAIQPLHPEDQDPNGANNAGEATLTVDCVVPVALNNKPGSLENSVNLDESGNVPTAVLTTQAGEYKLPLAFDATRIQPRSVRWGERTLVWSKSGGAAESHARGHLEDSYELDERTHDGDRDMVLQFRLSGSGLAAGTSQACVKGTFLSPSGTPWTFFGCDSVRPIGVGHTAWGTVFARD